MTPEDILKRVDAIALDIKADIDRLEARLEARSAEITRLCVLVENQLDKVTDLKAKAIRNAEAIQRQHDKCVDIVSRCPAHDITAFKKWAWGMIGAVALMLIGAWVKFEAALHAAARAGGQ